ncbi:tetratricopeptide repeat protein [Asanoa sp. WMMD1127]|uniref:ATP-binding protein n=1 Tax=Asanoa sp. WMMD1127 TaxID=3016107 RepID=UPI002416A4A7|nr:tetratricopeptide repeat protein [Asanoa sp. WMMD1127]MDG4826570.1 tetratricopeptide repeat protein [Asanoa sp. WMMD1127]
MGSAPRSRAGVGASIVVGAAGVAAAAAELSGNEQPHPLTVTLWITVAVLATANGVMEYRNHRLVEPAPSPRRPPVAQLPADIADFTGRDEVLAGAAEFFAATGPATPVWALWGKGGVGKTTAAVRVAHRLVARYPDGQLYVDLRGAEAEPRHPRLVLAEFLRALGVEGSVVPDSLADRAALLRSQVQGRRLLVFLDNAADETQVRPLLPGAETCGVIITSRKPLSALSGAQHVALPELDRAQALSLLAQVVGQRRVDAERAAAIELVDLCGRLPLAVRIVAGRLVAKPHWTLAEVVDRMRDERHLLVELRLGDLDVDATLRLSYAGLAPTDQAAFRLLGLLPAREFGVWHVAALRDDAAGTSADLVERMVDAQLVDARGRDALGRPRYRLHDLVHAFAVNLAAELPAEERAAAVARLAGAHLELAVAAKGRFEHGEVQIRGEAPRWGGADFAAAEVTDPVAWYAAEQPSLVAMVEAAYAESLWSSTWELAHTLQGFLELRAHWDDWRAVDDRALVAARAARSTLGEAAILFDLAALHRDRGDAAGALRHYRRSLDLYRAARSRHGEGSALLGLGMVYRNEARWHQAERRLVRAADLLTAAGDRRLAAQAARSLGIVLCEQGRVAEALDRLAHAGDAFRELGDLRAEAYTWRNLGDVHRGSGDLAAAADAYGRSLALTERIGDRRGQARALQGLARCALARGDRAAAVDRLTRAAAVVDGLGDAVLEASLRDDLRAT